MKNKILILIILSLTVLSFIYYIYARQPVKIINETKSPNYLVGKHIAYGAASSIEHYYLCKNHKIKLHTEPMPNRIVNDGVWQVINNKIKIKWKKRTNNYFIDKNNIQILDLELVFFETLFPAPSNWGIGDITFSKYSFNVPNCL